MGQNKTYIPFVTYILLFRHCSYTISGQNISFWFNWLSELSASCLPQSQLSLRLQWVADSFLSALKNVFLPFSPARVIFGPQSIKCLIEFILHHMDEGIEDATFLSPTRLCTQHTLTADKTTNNSCMEHIIKYQTSSAEWLLRYQNNYRIQDWKENCKSKVNVTYKGQLNSITASRQRPAQ